MNMYEKEKRLLEANLLEGESRLRGAYDVMTGYLMGCNDVYARAFLMRHLDALYEAALTANDQANTSAVSTGSVSTASSPSPSGGTIG